MSRRLVLILAMALAIPAAHACRRLPADMTPAAATSALRTDEGFTKRQNSPVGRQLVDVLVVRRIGRTSTEVEFTWRDAALPAGQADAPLRTSMALFRLQDDGQWRLTTLFRVD